jgi:hypothetical protein
MAERKNNKHKFILGKPTFKAVKKSDNTTMYCQQQKTQQFVDLQNI